MTEIGYALSSEEHSPQTLINLARQAEEVGFTFALISDHYHPWIDKQGQSPFVWSVIGGISQVTNSLRLGTGVTCPLIRLQPAIIAQAAATAACLMPERFFLGVGTGENLNEHILGNVWPPHQRRVEMLKEAVEVIRLLWQGGMQSYEGRYYLVEKARVYSLPAKLPPLYVAASGKVAATIAGAIGDGLISTSSKAEIVKTFDEAGGKGKPHVVQMTVCWADSEAEARRIALEHWPTAAIPGELNRELPLPAHFEQVAQLVTEEQIGQSVICGPSVQQHQQVIQEYFDAGYDQVCVHQIGSDQAGFFRFYEREILPYFET